MRYPIQLGRVAIGINLVSFQRRTQCKFSRGAWQTVSSVSDPRGDKRRPNGRIGTPKTENAIRTVAVSRQLRALLTEQITNQKAKGHSFLFTTKPDSPLDINLLRQRKLHPLLTELKMQRAGFHAFRHFSASLLDALRTPLKTIQDRLGHAASSLLTLDVYTHSEMTENMLAAQQARNAIEEAVNSVRLAACNEKGLPSGDSEALDA